MKSTRSKIIGNTIIRRTALVLGLAAAGFAFAQDGAGGLPSSEILQRVEQAGFSDVRDLEFDDGLWEVKALDRDGRRVELLVDPASGEIIDPRSAPALSADDIRSRLESQGYTRVRDIEYDDGRWEVEATNPRGEPVDLKLDPRDGSILREKVDHDD